MKSPAQRSLLFGTLCAGAVLCALTLQGSALAQSAPAASPAKPVATAPSRPLWSELTAAQQQALEPLTQLWPTMTEPHKRKWLALSKNYAQLSNDEKTVLQGRMREWAALSPQQRTLARLNFADAKQLPQEEKRAKWEAYQALSAEEKQKLATQQPKPVSGVAPAIKPVAAPKITPPPVATGSNPLPRIASDQANRSTLLPAMPAPAAGPVAAPASAEPAADTPQ